MINKAKFFIYIYIYLQYCLFLCSSLFLINCNNNSSKEYSYQVHIDTVRIEIPHTFLDNYISFDILAEQHVYVGYNHFDHSLQFIDLNKKVTKHTIKLEAEGPNGINTVGELFVTNDKIYLKSTPEWIIMDHKGQILERINFTDLSQELENKYIIDGGITMSYLEKKELSSDHTSIYLKLFPTNAEVNGQEIYEHPLFCKLNFYEKSIKIDPYLPYPEVFRKGYKFGILDKPSIEDFNDRLIYSFPNHSNIYIYHLKDSSISTHEVVSKKIKSVIEVNQHGSMRDILKNSFLSDRYHPVKYDPFKDIYYRVIRVKNNTQDINEYFLQIIDKQFTIITEIKLPVEEVYKNKFEITADGVFFQLMSSKTNLPDFSYLLINVQMNDR